MSEYENTENGNVQQNHFSTMFEQVGLPTQDQMDKIRNTFEEPTSLLEGLLPNTSGAAKEIRQVASSVNKMEPLFRDTIQSYKKSADAIAEASAQFGSMIENIKHMLSEMPAVKPFLAKILDACTILYDVIMAFLNKMFYTIPTLIVRLFQLFGVDTVLINKFIASVIKTSLPLQTAEGTRIIQQQAGEIRTLFSEGLGLLMLGKTPDMQQMRYVNEMMRLKKNYTDNISSFTDLALNIVQYVPDEISTWLQYVVPIKWWLAVFKPGSQYYTWIDQVNALDEHEHTIKAAYHPPTQRLVERLYKQGQDLLKLCTESGPKMSQVYHLLNDVFKKIDRLYKVVDMSALHRTTRPIPFVIYLQGVTGQGKSFISTILPAILAQCPHDEPNLSFARNAAIAHWDGYTGQFAVQYDDYGAVENPSVSPGEHAELMQIVSNEQMRLPMANLEDKGEVFRSQVVILTSNSKHIRPVNITDVQALWRRRHVCYEVSVKPEFRRGGRPEVDVNRIPADCSHWEFRTFDPMRDEPHLLGRSITYQEFITDVKNQYEAHRAAQARALANYETMVATANAAVPIQVIRQQGLYADFQAFAQTEADPGVKRVLSSFYEKLLEMEASSVKPAWTIALQKALPLMGAVTAAFALYKVCQLTSTRIPSKIEHEVTISVDKQAFIDLCQVVKVLQSERVKKIDLEGRWDRMYQDLKGMTPQLTKYWSDAMDTMPDFANLSDSEVEEIIDTVLRKPHVVKLLKQEGVYSASHYHGGFRGNLKAPVRVIKNEGSIDQSAMEVTTNRVVPSLAYVSVGIRRLIGMLVGGRMLLTPYHLFFDRTGEMLPDETEMVVWVGTTKYRMLFYKQQLFKAARDVAVYHMDANIQPFKDSTNNFISEADVDFKKPFPGLVAALTQDCIPLIMRTEGSVQGNVKRVASFWNATMADSIREGQTIYDDWFDPERDHIIEELTAWEYNCQSWDGMCGAPLIQLNRLAARKIVGIHIGGDVKGMCIAVPVTCEMLFRAKAHFGFTVATIPIPDSVNEHKKVGVIRLQGNMTKVGTLARPIFINEKTKIIPSITHGRVYSVQTAPAVLSQKDLRSFSDIGPMKLGVEKYGNIAPPIKLPILRKVEEHLSIQLSKLDGGMERRVCSVSEALNGIPGDPFLKHIDMNTSAGYPWNKRKDAKGKKHLIRGDENNLNYEIVDPELNKAVHERMAMALQGKRVPSLWSDSLKDERRTFDRIMTGKTRVFTIPPLPFTIVSRQLFNAFTSAFYANRLKFFSAVGIDPAGMEWTHLYNALNNNSSLGFAGDYSGWDGNLSPNMMMSVCNIINNWYGEKEDKKYKLARIVIFEELIHTMQVAGDEVYITHIGGPSGNPFTVIVNTILNAIYKRYIFLDVVPVKYNSLICYDEHVKDFEYGDDDIVSITVEILKYFNPTIISEYMLKLNMKYTSSFKDGPAEIRPIKELTFLKRGFRDNGFGRKVPTIDMKTITELCNWTRSCKDLTVEEASIDNLNDSLAFMYFYGNKHFVRHRDRILKALDRKFHDKIFDFDYFDGLYGRHSDVYVIRQQSQVTTSSNSAGGGGDPEQGKTISTAEQSSAEDIRTPENTMGIASAFQRKEEVSGPTVQPIVPRRLETSCFGDSQWTLQQMVQRRVWIGTYSWPVSAATGDMLYTGQLPSAFIQNFLQSAPFERFLYWRGSIIVHIEITGMRQQLGRLAVYHVPYTDVGFVNVWHKVNFATVFGLNPSFLEPATNPKVDYVIPYYNTKTAISINGQTQQPDLDNVGTFCVQVLVPLGSAACAPQEVNFTIWCEFSTDAHFHIPLHSSATGMKFYNQEHMRQFARRAEQIPKEVYVIRQQGNTNSVTNEFYGNIDHSTVPTNLTGDDFSGAASGNKLDMVPFDRAARTWNPVNIVRKYIQNFANSNGSEGLTRLDLNPSNMAICLRDHFSTNEDEMKMGFLLHRPTFVANVPWPGTAPYGTSLYSGFIGPMCSLFKPGTQDQISLVTGQRVPLTQWEYNAMRFAYWKGGMRIRVDVIATQFHVGQLALCLNYGASPDTEVDLRDATSQYAYHFEISNEKRCFEFDIPYVAPTPVLQMCRGPKATDDAGPTTGWWANYFTGSWSLRVVTKLQTVCNSPPDAVVQISYSGATDFEVYMPSMNNQTFSGAAILGQEGPVLPRKPVHVIKMQSSDVKTSGDDAARVPPILNAMHVRGLKIAPPDHKDVERTWHFGEKAFITDRRQVLRRYYSLQPAASMGFVEPAAQATAANDNFVGFTSLRAPAVAPSSAVRARIYYFIPLTPGPNTLNTTYTTYNYHLVNYTLPLENDSLQYRFWRGSFNFKIFFGDIHDTDGTRYDNVFGGVTHIPHGMFQFFAGTGWSAARPNAAALALNYGMSFAPGDPDYHDTEEASVFATDASARNVVNYCEIQIPFATRYNTLITAHSFPVAQMTPSNMTSGMLLIWQDFIVPASKWAALTTVGSDGIRAEIIILQSVGDDFRFGTYLGVPNVYPVRVTNTTVGFMWPDSWVVTAAPEDIKQPTIKEEDTSDEEIVIVPKRKIAVIKQQGLWMSKNVDIKCYDFENLHAFHLLWGDDNAQYSPKSDIDMHKVITIQRREKPSVLEQFFAERAVKYMRQRLGESIQYTLNNLCCEHGMVVDTTFVDKNDEFGLWLEIKWHFETNLQITGEHWFKVNEHNGKYCLDLVVIFGELYRAIYEQLIPLTPEFQQVEEQQRKDGILEDIHFTVNDINDTTTLSPICSPENLGGTTLSKYRHSKPVYIIKQQSQDLGDDKPDYMERHARMIEETKKERGGLDHEWFSRSQPTTQVLVGIIRDLWVRYEKDPMFNARMAMNELTQFVETAKFTYETDQAGQSHIPNFYTHGMFVVDNKKFSKVTGEGTATRKKDSIELCAKQVLVTLHDIANIEHESFEMLIPKMDKMTVSKNFQEIDFNMISPITPEDHDVALVEFMRHWPDMNPDHLRIIFNTMTKLDDILPQIRDDGKLIQALLGFGYHLKVDVFKHTNHGSGILKIVTTFVGLGTNPTVVDMVFAPMIMKEDYMNRAIAVNDAVRSALTKLVSIVGGKAMTFAPDHVELGI